MARIVVDKGRITTVKDLESWRFQNLSTIIISIITTVNDDDDDNNNNNTINSTSINSFDKTKDSREYWVLLRNWQCDTYKLPL